MAVSLHRTGRVGLLQIVRSVKFAGAILVVLAVALQLRQALALFWVPQNDLLVTPAAREKLAVKTPGDRPDPTAAIFSNVREHICNGRLRLSPPESTPLPR
jgi:hypothetical protein